MEAVARFVQETTAWLQLERAAEEAEAYAAQTGIALTKLEAKGVALHRLHVCEMRTGLYGRTVVTLATRRHGLSVEAELPATQLGSGSIVDLRMVQSDGAIETVATGVVVRLSSTRIQVAFDDALERELPDHALALVVAFNDTTMKRLKHCLTQLAEGSGTCLAGRRVRDVLFGTVHPVPHPAVEFHPFNDNLNKSQQQAIGMSLSGNEVSIIHGPPGTGKTTTVVELIAQMVARGEKVLACAPSNVAVDNMVERLAKYRSRPKIVRLGHPARLLESIQQYSLDALVARSDETSIINDVRKDMDRVQQHIIKAGRGARAGLRQEYKALRTELRERERKAVEHILRHADVVLGTTSSVSLLGPLRHVPPDHFTVALVDEAGQALEASCWMALLQAPRCVLAGDHMQLPPTVLSEEAGRQGLGRTLLERATQLLGPEYVCLLNTQYRMHEAIMQWSSNEFYGGRLVAAEAVRHHLLCNLPGVLSSPETTHPVVFIDTAGCAIDEVVAEDDISKANPGEADIVRKYVAELVASGIAPTDIGVITPYNLQVELLRSILVPLYGTSIEIRSVDGFQGREKLVIVLSLVRSNPRNAVGFLSDFRRINVAITRAQRHVMLVGNSSTLNNDRHLATLITYFTAGANGAVDYRSGLEYVDGVVSHEPSGQVEARERKLPHDRPAAAPFDPEAAAAAREAETVTRREAYRRQLQAFLRRKPPCEKVFSASLNSFDRRLIHELCEELDIHHRSEGEGAARTVHIWQDRPLPAYPAVDGDKVTCKPQASETNIVDAVSSVTDPKAGQDKSSSPPEETLVAVVPVPTEPITSTGMSTVALETVICTAEAASPTAGLCGLCGQAVPEDNMHIHQLRCERLARQRAREEAHTQQLKALKVSQQAAQRATKPNQSSGGGGDSSSSRVRFSEDEMLTKLAANANRCHYPLCTSFITLLGSICKHCKWKYCMTHALPEVHGCGAEARRKLGSKPANQPRPPPESKSQQARKETLHRKLQKSLEEKATDRSKKDKKK